MAVDRLLEIALGNASFALALAIAVAVASRWVRRPGVLHLLWLLVLARLLTPPIFEVALLPARPGPASSGSFVTMSALAGAPPAAVSQVDALFGLGLRGALLLGSLIGTAALVVLAAARTLRLVRSVKTGAQPGADLLERVARVARLMAVRPPRVRLVSGQLPPMLWGVPSRAVLILPESLVPTLGQDELDAVIAHELAHLRRRDHWVRLLELAAVVLFWWNPASWWASSGLREAEEECCDALVAKSCPGSSGAYARGLVKTMGFLAGADTFFPAVVTGASHFRHIERRIRMIMTGGFARSLSAPLRVGLVIVALSALVIAPTMAARAGSSAGASEADASKPVGAPITLKLDHAFLNDVLLSIGKIAGVDILIDSRATMKVHSTRVSCDFVDTPWDEVLGALLQQAGLAWSVQGGEAIVHLPGEMPPSPVRPAGEPMSVRFHDADVRSVLKMLARSGGTPIEVDPDVNGKVSGNFTGMPWGVVFDSVVRANGFTWRLENGVYHVSRAREEAEEGTRPAEAPVDRLPSVEVVDGRRVYRYVHGGEITEPVRVQTPPPDYTPEARRARIQGVVVLDAVIDAEGRVASVKVLGGLPLGLTESAQEAVREWRFEPATLHGAPVAVKFILAVRFSLGEEVPSPTPSPEVSAPQ
jgi:TonB family protein